MRFWSIPGTLVAGYREAIGLLVGGGMALVFGLIFAITGTGALIQEYQFLTNSSTGIAEVIGKQQTGQKNFYVEFRLLSGGAGKTVYERSIPVYSGLWQNLRKGQTLNVDYLRNDPSNMRLVGSVGNVGDSLLHVLIGGLLLMIAVPVSIGAIQFLVRTKREG
jgi:Protein of unknown function (DUF3592)